MDFFRGALGAVHNKQSSGALTGKTVTVEGFRLRVGAPLATGGFGFVYHATDADTGAPYALKHTMPGESPEALEVARVELQVAECIRAHPHAVRLLAAAPRPPRARTDCFFLLELAQESLAEQLRSRPGGLPEHEALLVCRAVASVLAALHSSGVCHWDVKAENVLRAGAAGWKLCDYGSATLRPPGPASARERGQLEDVILRRTTPAYRAPEMWDLFRNATLGPAADVWALGCLLGVALGAPPFGPDDKLRMLSATFRPPLRASPAVAALQQRALALSPDARPTAVQLLAELDELLAAGAAAPPQAAAAAPPPLPPRAPPPLPAKPHAAGVDPAAGLSAADAGWTASFD